MLGITHRLPVAASTERPQHPWLRSVWNTVTGMVGVMTGLAPHVLHHAGLLAGTALVAGLGGTLIFGVIGLVASVPILLRLHRRFHTWHAPAISLAVFAVLFSLSALVIGPAINGTDSAASTSTPPQTQTTDHAGHH